MLAKVFFQFALATLLGIGVDEGYGTLYGQPGDPYAGGNLACEGKPIPLDEPVCAHRWLPCGTQLVVQNLARPGLGTCRVGDRGPYGVDRYGRWRGIVDMTPFAAKSVNLDGRDFVRMVYKLPKPGHAVYANPLALNPPRRAGPSM
jgi:hypothetical protein